MREEVILCDVVETVLVCICGKIMTLQQEVLGIDETYYIYSCVGCGEIRRSPNKYPMVSRIQKRKYGMGQIHCCDKPMVRTLSLRQLLSGEECQRLYICSVCNKATYVTERVHDGQDSQDHQLCEGASKGHNADT